MLTEVIILVIIVVLLFVVEFFVFQKNKKYKESLIKREEEAKHKMYEIAILNELSDKMGYSLNVQNVIELITKSLKDFIDYTVASYMIFLPEKIIFRSYAEKPVAPAFIVDIKTKMLDTSSALLSTDLKNTQLEEKLWGADLSEEAQRQVGSYFYIPLKVSGKISGLIAVADAKKNAYSEEKIKALKQIASQATLAFSRLKEAIESENSRMNATVASMTDGVVMTDIDNRILVVNPAAKKALGFENKNDLQLSDFVAGLSGRIDLKDKIEESIRLEKVFVSDEIVLLNTYYKIIVSPVRDSWKMLGCVVVFRDMTREKEVERIKEDFTSMIVHELRSPLDSIKKMTGLMRVSEATKIKRAECFQMIYSSSADMLELINNLLDIAKIEAGKFQLLKQPSDIAKIVNSRISFFDITAKDAKVKLISCFAKDIPVAVEFDPHTISQVLNNLISNAIKFTKENGNIVIQVLLHKKGGSLADEAKTAEINWFVKNTLENIPDALVVAVTDSGIGIPADQMGKLFNKFVQAKSTFVEKGGTGLGLAITKSIIDSHGGVVGAESVEGQGSTFYFTLPV